MTPNHPAIKPQTFDFSDRRLYNRAYLPLFRNTSRFLHLFGSAGSGKSVFGCQREVVLSFQSERRNRKTLIVRKVYNTLANSVYSEIKNVIYEWNLGDCFDILRSPLQITNKLTGVTFIFVGLDDVEKVKSIRGVDRILIEEATELKEQSELDQLNLRLRGFTNSQITLMYNPISVHHWINREIHEKRPEGHFVFKTTYRDNERLLSKDPDYAINIERLKDTNPNYYKIYGLGQWGNQVEGLVYPEYTVVDTMPPVQRYGLDFGYNDPTALVAIAIEDTPNQSKKSLFVQEILFETRHTSDTLAARFDALQISKSIPILADSARPEMIAALRKAGYNVTAAEKGKGSIKAGIDNVKLYDLKIVAGSKETLKEIASYSWRNKDGAWMDEPTDTLNHAMDAMRYALQPAPTSSQTKFRR